MPIKYFKNIISKKIYILLVIIIAILIGVIYCWNFLKINREDNHGCFINKGYSWCGFKNKCIKQGEEDCDLTQDWILDEAKKIIGLDLNLMPNGKIKWKTEGSESTFSAKGVYYLDALRAEKIMKGFEDFDKFLNGIGLENDPNNPPVISDRENIMKYKEGKFVCELKRTDNPNNTSSLGLFCGNIDDILCDFKSSCGKECKTDGECGHKTDGCGKRMVCRNKNYKFYNDCANPTSNIDELDVSIGSCLCLENYCVPKNEELRSKN